MKMTTWFACPKYPIWMFLDKDRLPELVSSMAAYLERTGGLRLTAEGPN